MWRSPTKYLPHRAPPPAAHAVDLRKTYGTGQATVHALAGIDVTFERGRFTAVMGPSGSGKSTLMHCMAGLDRPTSGHTFVGDLDIGPLDDKRAHPDAARPHRLRLPVVQPRPHADRGREHHAAGRPRRQRRWTSEWFDYLVGQLGIGDRLSHRPTEMSGGQQQRCACARALISRPDLIFADEPTGNLDSNSSAEMLAFLRRSVTEFGQSIVMVTHDPRGASYADRVVFLADGAIVDEMADPTPESVLERIGRLGA